MWTEYSIPMVINQLPSPPLRTCQGNRDSHPTRHENAPGALVHVYVCSTLKNSLKHRELGAPCHSCPPSRNGAATDGFMSSNLTTPQPSSDQSAQISHHGSHLRAGEQVRIHTQLSTCMVSKSNTTYTVEGSDCLRWPPVRIHWHPHGSPR